MRSFLRPNLDRRGRLVRGLIGAALLGAAAVAWSEARWLAGLLGAGGVFSLYEAARGWCLARACGVKTRV
jgi:hypothetical protein